jgi:hypothetical protein
MGVIRARFENIAHSGTLELPEPRLAIYLPVGTDVVLSLLDNCCIAANFCITPEIVNLFGLLRASSLR